MATLSINAPPTITPEEASRFDRNLAALQTYQPELADRLRDTPWPDGLSDATARDGTRTFLCIGPDGRRRWLGQSSMPTISSQALFGQYPSDGAGVTLPGMLTGREALTLIDRLPSHAAVFVVEEDARLVRAALHLHDYTDAFARGRIVLIVGDDPAAALAAFFTRHPGYEPPRHLLTVPQRSAAAIAELQRRLESAGEAIHHIQQQAGGDAVRRIIARDRSALPDAPRVALLAVDPGPAALEQASRIERAMDALGWQFTNCIPDRPGKCHVVARLQAVAGIDADLVLFVQGGAGPLRNLLPPSLPIVSWYLPGAAVLPDAIERPGPKDMVFVADTLLRRRLQEAGLPAERLTLCSPAADAVAFAPTDEPAPAQEAKQINLLVLSRAADDSPAACGINLTSHERLWDALRQSAATGSDRGTLRIERLLEEAQRLSGVRLNDPALREQFLQLIRARILPAAEVRMAIKAAGSHFDRIEVHGASLRLEQNEKLTVNQSFPTGHQRHKRYTAAHAILFPDGLETSLQPALDALATGRPVICRAGHTPLAELAPDLTPIEPCLGLYHNRAELSARLRRLCTTDPVSREKLTDAILAARQLVLERHTVSHRLRDILDKLRTPPAS